MCVFQIAFVLVLAAAPVPARTTAEPAGPDAGGQTVTLVIGDRVTVFRDGEVTVAADPRRAGDGSSTGGPAGTPR